MVKESDEKRELLLLAYRARRFWNARKGPSNGRVTKEAKGKRSMTKLWIAAWRRRGQVRSQSAIKCEGASNAQASLGRRWHVSAQAG